MRQNVCFLTGVVSDMVAYFLDIEYHEAIRGCPMDFTEDHADVAEGLAKGRFCPSCSKKFR